MLVMTCPGPFLSGEAPPFVPTDIAGLLVWVQGSSLAALADGDPVASWTDESGNNHHLAQASSTKRPLYRATLGPGGAAAVEFDGSDDQLLVTYTTAWPLTIFTVIYQVTYGGGRIIYDGPVAAASGLRQNPSSGSVRQQASLNGASVNLGLTTWGLVTTVFDTTSTIALNGNADVSSNPGTGAPTGFRLGTAGVRFAEVLVYDSALSAGNQASVKAYLNTKYGLY